MIPSEIKYDANATPPHWTDNNDQIIEKGTNIRVKIKGIRSEVDKQFAVATVKEVRFSMSCLECAYSSLCCVSHLGLD